MFMFRLSPVQAVAASAGCIVSAETAGPIRRERALVAAPAAV